MHTEAAKAKVESEGEGVDIAYGEGGTGGVQGVTEDVGERETQEEQDDVTDLGNFHKHIK